MKWSILATFLGVAVVGVFLGMQYYKHATEGPASPPVDVVYYPSTVVSMKSEERADLSLLWASASEGTALAGYPWGVSGDDDFYDGGADTDTLQYYGNRSSYEIVRSPLKLAGMDDMLLIRKKADDSLDIVVNVEVIVFADARVIVADLLR